jgi:hypothetical protein
MANADVIEQGKSDCSDIEPAEPGESDKEQTDQSSAGASHAEQATTTETSGVIVTSTATSMVDTQESTEVLRHFRRALFDLANHPAPDITETQPDRKLTEAYRWIFLPWRFSGHIGYYDLVAKYVGLWSTLERPEAQHYRLQAFLGLEWLKAGKLTTAYGIFSEIEFQTSTPAALSYVMRGIGYFLRWIVVLTLVVAYSAFFPFFVWESVSLQEAITRLERFFNSPLGEVLVATLAGMLGSVVSLLLRIGEFESTKGRSQMFLILTGATLPVVGGIFGAFVAALISSKVVNIGVSGPDRINVWLYVVLGFLSGFSERFSKGFVRIAEDRLGVAGARSAALQLSTATVVAPAKTDAGTLDSKPAG